MITQTGGLSGLLENHEKPKKKAMILKNRPSVIRKLRQYVALIVLERRL
jgi:hypothetical protein